MSVETPIDNGNGSSPASGEPPVVTPPVNPAEGDGEGNKDIALHNERQEKAALKEKLQASEQETQRLNEENRQLRESGMTDEQRLENDVREFSRDTVLKEVQSDIEKLPTFLKDRYSKDPFSAIDPAERKSIETTAKGTVDLYQRLSKAAGAEIRNISASIGTPADPAAPIAPNPSSPEVPKAPEEPTGEPVTQAQIALAMAKDPEYAMKQLRKLTS